MHNCTEVTKFILCIIEEVTNYSINVPKHQSRLEEIGNVYQNIVYQII